VSRVRGFKDRAELDAMFAAVELELGSCDLEVKV